MRPQFVMLNSLLVYLALAAGLTWGLYRYRPAPGRRADSGTGPR